MQNLSSEEIKKLDLQQLVEYLESKVPEIYRTSNNFHLHFVDGWYRPEKDDEVRWARRNSQYATSRYSERNKSETRREFYANVDAVVFEITGKDYMEYHKALKEASISNKDLTDEEIALYAASYSELVTPVLEKLFNLGYNEADLCG